MAATPRSPSLTASAVLQPSYQLPLLLTVRFSTSLPDVLLDIPRPATTTVVALKHLIRSRLAEPSSQRRLRFIHGGKILPDGAVLSAVLKAPPPPPGPGSGGRGGVDGGDPKGKGKAVAGSGGPPQRVYINCSIGDSLTDEELKKEAEAAEAPVPLAPGVSGAHGTAKGKAGTGASSGLEVDTGNGAAGGRGFQARGGTGTVDAASGERTPRGFDRLLAAGFTAAEVNQLRLQFRSIQAARHTPDTMPSPDTLRGMEDTWMDNNNDAGSGYGPGAGLEVGGGAPADPAEEFGMNGLLDALIPGMMVGFVMPLATVMWLVREEGLLSKRWRVLMSFGFVLSLAIGVIRALSGESE